MLWIALQPTHEDELEAWGWRALQFTPRVARLDEALVLEVSACLRLFGGRQRLLRRLLKPLAGQESPGWAEGASSLQALALLRLARQGGTPPARLPHGLPLGLLSAARDHVPILERMGCRTWGELHALPRAGLARRFGPALLQALDEAFAQRQEQHRWLALPQVFDQRLELPSLAQGAPELIWTGQRLLAHLQAWLQARNLGVLAFEVEWTLDQRRLDGRELPPTGGLQVGTARPTQDMAHLRKLLAEHLERARLQAPASHLRLRSLDVQPFGGLPASLLPEDHRQGEALHQLVERLSVRLGEENVTVPVPQQDHRPECMQRWEPARHHAAAAVRPPPEPVQGDALYPPWLLRTPRPLQVKKDVPHYMGPLRLLSRPMRLEGAWWEGRPQGPVLRDYFIARGEQAGLVWIFRERTAPSTVQEGFPASERWFLQGLYA